MADAASFDEFYLGARDRLALQVAALTGDPVEALDHVQEAFVRAWLRWDKIRDYDDAESWVRRVACNQAVSRWRRARRTVLRAEPDVRETAFDAEQLELIDALRGLSSEAREAIVLHHLAGYPVEEVGKRMAAPVGTVKSWLSRGPRGRARLATTLGDEVAADDAR